MTMSKFLMSPRLDSDNDLDGGFEPTDTLGSPVTYAVVDLTDTRYRFSICKASSRPSYESSNSVAPKSAV